MESKHQISLSEETAVSIDPDSSDVSLSDINVTVEDRDALAQITELLQDLLPDVTTHLSEHNHIEELVAFFKLINAKDFDVNYFGMSSNLHKSETFIQCDSLQRSKNFGRSGCLYFMQNVYVIWEDIKH